MYVGQTFAFKWVKAYDFSYTSFYPVGRTGNRAIIFTVKLREQG